MNKIIYRYRGGIYELADLKKAMPNICWPPFVPSEATLAEFGITREIQTTEDARPSLDVLKADKKAQAKAARYAFETGGLTQDGVSVCTDRESVMLIYGAAARGKALNWKQADGTFVELTAAQLTALAAAVGDHVEAAFDREKAINAAIDAAANEIALAAVDMSFA